MKIVMLTPDSYMIDRRIILEAQTLIQAGHKVILLAGFETPQEEHFEQDSIQIHRYCYDWDDERLKKIRAKLPANERLLGLANKIYMFLAKRFFEISPFDRFIIAKALEFDADVYHIHDLPCLKAGWYAAKARNVPLIYDAHELYYAQSVLPRKLQKQYFALEKKYIKYPQVVITVNSFIADLMAKRYQIKKPQVIMNCTEKPKNFSLEQARQKLQEKGNIPTNYKIILYQGWISAERNIETIVEGVKWFPKDTCLAIIGYGNYESTLREIAKQQGVADKVFFLGQVPSDEMLNYSAGADVGVIPYQAIDDNHLYCSPNKFFEYVLAGVPIIAEDLPFFRLMNEKYGMVETTNMGSPEALGKLISDLINDTSRLYSLRENCYHASQELNWVKESEKLLTIYNQVINEKT
ncbi:glycosyltransferase [Anabaena sp. CCY 9402-a]|uniref:glycosyltransferase n=1 Tax=Anabaena sp. CCY 9402-a TaxID=3103867 RepID=UPI0039C6F031